MARHYFFAFFIILGVFAASVLIFQNIAAQNTRKKDRSKSALQLKKIIF